MRIRNHRRLERIHFAFPFTGKLGTSTVAIRDLSLFGARLEHAGPLPVGAQLALRFTWKDHEVSLSCETLRCKLESFGDRRGTVYHTGIRFTERVNAAVTLREIIVSHVARALEEQKANARGVFRDYEQSPIFMRGLLTINRADFAEKVGENLGRPDQENAHVSYRLDGRHWRKVKTRSSQQPEEGFTLLADEDPWQVELLCETYLMVEEEGRQLIRILSELSILGEGIPAGRFKP